LEDLNSSSYKDTLEFFGMLTNNCNADGNRYVRLTLYPIADINGVGVVWVEVTPIGEGFYSVETNLDSKVGAAEFDFAELKQYLQEVCDNAEGDVEFELKIDSKWL